MTWVNWLAFYTIIIISVISFVPRMQRSINNATIALKAESFLLRIEKNYSTYILIFLMIVAAGVRLWKFGMIPGGFNQDGALGAVDAFALERYGTDHFGMRFPVHFTAWGYGQMSVLLSYLSIPFIALLGLNTLSARLPILIISLLALWVLYSLCKLLFGKKAAIVILAFCSINPWQIMQSRWALDCNMFPHFLLFSVYFLLLAFKKNRRYLYISMLLFGITMYSYGITWYTVPLFLFITCLYLLITKKLKLRETVLSILTYLVIAWPIFAVMIINFFKLPSIVTPIFTIPFFPDTVRTADMIFFSTDVIKQIINNLKTVVNVAFFQVPDLPWNTIPEYGTIYLFSIPFAIIGFTYLFKKLKLAENDERLSVFILIWLMIAVLSGIIINNVNVNRINIILYPLIILCGLGIYSVIRNVKLTGFVITIIYFIAFVGFSFNYFGTHAKIMGDSFYAGFGEALKYVNDSDYDRIYVTSWTQSENSWWVSEPLTLFHNQIDAKYYQGTAAARSKSDKLLLPYKERYKYVSFKEQKINPDENAVYVVYKKEVPYFNHNQFNLEEFSNYYAVTPKNLKVLSNTAKSPANVNLVSNPGFENASGSSFKSWNMNVWDKTAGVSEINLDNQTFKSGGKSIYIKSQKPNDARIEQQINVEANSLYKLSCWIKAKDIGTENAGAHLSISGLFASTNEVKGTSSDWEYVEMYGRTGENQTSLTFSVGIGGYGSTNTGEAWFDDVLVQKVNDIPAGTTIQDLFAKASPDNSQKAPANKTYGSAMIYFLIIYLIMVILIYILTVKKVVKLPQSKSVFVLCVIFVSGFVLRLILAKSIEGMPNDVACFKAWAVAAANNFSGLYKSGIFLDYPPLYMYVLFIIGKLASIPALGSDFTLLVKLPSILADMATAYLLYRLTETKYKAGFGYLAAAIFIFNPAIILNSSIWGMVDSFFMLFVITALLLVVNDKIEYSVIFFAASVLMKPQGVFFLPVLLFEVIKKRSLKKLAMVILFGFITTIAIILPFFSIHDPLWIFKLYLNTASGYPYSSLNAYNLFSLIGTNLKPDSAVFFIFSYNTWGLIFDIAVILFTCFIYFKYKNAAAPLLAALLLNIGLFVLSTRMHERYMYPAILICVLLFIYIKDKRLPLIFGALTFTITLNMQDVLYRALNSDSPHIPSDNPLLLWGSAMNVVIFICMAVLSIKLLNKKNEYQTNKMRNYKEF